jgi:hypothetical protein
MNRNIEINITMEKKKKPFLTEVLRCFLRRFTKMPAMKLKIVSTRFVVQRFESESKIILFSRVLYSATQTLEPMLNMQGVLYIPLQKEVDKSVY